MNRYLLLIFSLILTTGLWSHYEPGYEISEETETGDAYSDRIFTETLPPPGQVRPVAEFEPASHVLIRYPLGIPVSMVAQLANVADVICIVGSSTYQNQAITAFQNAGVNMNKVSFMLASTNTYWTRDYGPLFIFNGNNQLGVVDFPYNRPNRPLDDEIPRTFALNNSFPLYGMNVYQTGGNYMTDGINTAAQTTLVYSENSSQTTHQIHQKMHDYLGISNYFVVPDPNNNYIEHIDCWGKFLAPDKVLIRSVPTSHAQYNAIESVANYFINQNCGWGYPYKVYRVNTPNNQPYTNSLILNKTVFVPIMNSTYDSAALQAYRNALPGYNIIGVTGNSSAPWSSTDALHCRTHEIPDRNMLYVQHQPYHNGNLLQESYNISAFIYPHSNQPLYSDSVYVKFKINQDPWLTAQLLNTETNMFSTNLGMFTPGDTIRYYIHAADMSGRSISHPLTGALDPHMFWVILDNTPPTIAHNPLNIVDLNQLPLTISAIVSDNYNVQNAQVVYKVDDSAETTMEMNNFEDNMWIATINPFIAPQAQHFYYKIIAYDSAIPTNTGYAPSQGWFDAIIQSSTTDDNYLAENNIVNAIYPNPYRYNSNNSLIISIRAKKNIELKANIYNLKGQLVRSLKTRTGYEGIHNLSWDGKDNKMHQAVAGVYFIKVDTEDKSVIAKLLVLK